MPPRNRTFRYFIASVVAGAFGAVVAASVAQAFDVERWDKSVVRVINFEIRDGKRQNSYGIGTGFVIAPEYLLTNHHVIDDAEYKKRNGRSEYAIVDGSIKNIRKAELVWSAPELDLAVIRVPGLTRPSLALSSAPMTQYPGRAEIVWAIGFPGVVDATLKSDDGAYAQSTVTKGVVAKIAMGSMEGGDDKARPVVQHSASFNKGNSGGPLLDDCGVVVGVNTFAPYAIMQISKDQGKDVAHGMPNTGVFFSPHIGNFVEAHKTNATLKAIRINTTSEACPTGAGETAGMPVWGYVGIGVVGLLALAATLLALRKGATREVVRMVESYSAYVKRKGRPPSEESMMPRPVTSPPDISSMPASKKATPVTPKPTAGGGWKFSGKDSQGKAIALAFSADAIAAATAKKEGGLVIGRSATLADSAVEDASVSRRHAKIYATENDGLAIEDLKSAYGTKVNGHALEAFQAVEVKAGDTVTLGGVELTVARGR
jgi:S1-C subfamily serine protease